VRLLIVLLLESVLPADRVSVRVVDTPDRSEVMLLATARVSASPEAFRACVSDPSCLRASEDLLGAGRLPPAPTAVDLEAVPFPRAELLPLERCRVGDCPFRLDAATIEALRLEVDWSLPRPEEAAAEVLRRALLGYARDYLARGNRALPFYENNDHPVASGESLRRLLERPLPPLDDAPELRRYLSAFPEARPAAVEEYLCWSREKVWRKRVLALDHVVVYEAREGGAVRVVAAAKRIYASHCFESSLEILALERREGEAESSLVYASRSRADIRPAGFSWLERLLIRRLGRGRLQDHLEALRDRLEGVRAARR
jgi:hypothetical protein